MAFRHYLLDGMQTQQRNSYLRAHLYNMKRKLFCIRMCKLRSLPNRQQERNRAYHMVVALPARSLKSTPSLMAFGLRLPTPCLSVFVHFLIYYFNNLKHIIYCIGMHMYYQKFSTSPQWSFIVEFWSLIVNISCTESRIRQAVVFTTSDGDRLFGRCVDPIVV